MKKLTALYLFYVIVSCQAQPTEKFNLGFENNSSNTALSDGWIQWGNYDLTIDSLSHSGYKAGKITANDKSSFGSFAYKIPANYKCKTIELQGFMKTKNVTNGFAGLLLRIDGNDQSLAFDNMQNQNISGTNDWKKYSITFNYPDNAEYIVVAGILSGKGEAWFDDFVIYLDGQNIQNLKEVERPIFKASLDKEFDNGSNLDNISLNAETIDALEVLGRVWGFLKYYHVEIAKGNYNWDYELFRFLPNYLNEADRTKKEELLLKWIDSFGKLDPCKSCPSSADDVFLKPDLSWTTSRIGTSNLQNKLWHIYNNRNIGKNYYIKMAENVGNPEFLNEKNYANIPFPDAGFRLLALYRYWNMIHYFFPYKHLIDKDWNAVMTEYLPKLVNAKDELEYELSALQLIGEIHDTHANLWGGNNKIEEWKGGNYAPVHLRFIENKLVVCDYYNPELKDDTGLEIGDIITKINGKIVTDLVSAMRPYYPASNEAARLRDISADMLRSTQKEMAIEYNQNGTLKTKKLKLYPANELNIYQWYRLSDDISYRMLKNNIGYVTLMSIKDEDIPNIKETFKNTKGIIIDIRNYPSTFVPFSLGSYFVNKSTPFVKFTNGNVHNAGEFTFTQNLEIPNDEITYKGKLIVLVNELSQSQAEYTAMAFRAGAHTTIIGSTTAGADGNVSPITLPGGLRTLISGIGVYYPDGKETQRLGIIPDIIITPTINGIKSGKDELLEKAIEVILSE